MHFNAATHNWVLPDTFIICGSIGRQDRLGLQYLVFSTISFYFCNHRFITQVGYRTDYIWHILYTIFLSFQIRALLVRLVCKTGICYIIMIILLTYQNFFFKATGKN